MQQKNKEGNEMGKKYNTELQEALEVYLQGEKISQAKAAPLIGVSQSVLSQYRRSMYDKGDIGEVEKKIAEFLRIREEKREHVEKAKAYRQEQGYIPTSISESVYKLIRYCQLEKGVVVIDGDAGIGKTKAAAKFLQDNPANTVYIKASPSTSTLRSMMKIIARALKLPENQRTDDMSLSIQETLRNTDKIIVIDEAQNLKFSTLEEITRWTDEDMLTGKPGVGIVLIGNVEVYNRMLGRQEAMFAQQFNRSRLHGRYRTTDTLMDDVDKLFPILASQGLKDEAKYLYQISRSKWGIRGMVNVFNNAANNEDITKPGLEKMANTMGIRLI
jgi:DNA transposition AAA+ family ATPase